MMTVKDLMDAIPEELWDEPIVDIDGQYDISKAGYIEDKPFIALETTFSNLSKTSQEQLRERGILND